MAPICSVAQSRPGVACTSEDDRSVVGIGPEVQLAEVAKRGTVQLLCGSSNGCMTDPAALGTPVQVYRSQGEWTCGYVSGRQGAGPAWILTEALRVVPSSKDPLLSAWSGHWTDGYNHLRIGAGQKAGTLHLVGTAQWQGRYSTHSGGLEGSSSPTGNNLHFVEDSCTVDLTLIGHYIVMSDNMGCGGANVRFQGIWKRLQPKRLQPPDRLQP